MDVDDFNLVVVLEVLAQFCDVHVHRACVEVVVVNPYGLEGKVALQNLVGVAAQECEQLVLLCGELGLLVADCEQLLLCVECESSDVVDGAFLALLATYTTQDGLYTEHEFFH